MAGAIMAQGNSACEVEPGPQGTQSSAGTPLPVLQSSKDPAELQSSALALASSKRAADHRALLGWLSKPEFLRRLDSDSAYGGSAQRLRLAPVLSALSSNSSPSAQGTLVALTQRPTFVQSAPRADLLIEACAALRPTPPEVVRFWDDHSRPEDGFTNRTIEAMVQNGSPPALALLEKKMIDPAHDEDDKRAWMLSSILTHRNDLSLLKSCERLLTGKLGANLRPVLVEALFDYRPTEWFSPATVLKPPDRDEASPAARAELRSIGAYALEKVTLSENQRSAVRKTLGELSKRP
jgi:hypothetical protein